MKKSKIKLLTATACLALVGTASAAWVYAGTATASANIGVKVASYASAGTITVSGADNVYVYLDKGSVTFEKTDESKALSAKYEKPSGFDDVNKAVTKTFDVVISDGLKNVIAFATSTTSGISWTDDSDIFNSLPSLQWNSEYMTSGNEFSGSEDGYKSFVATYTGNSKEDYDSWYDSNTSYTFKSEYNVTINFKAVVAD